MTTYLESAQLEAQAQLRSFTDQSVVAFWSALPHYDRANIDEWLTKVLPVIEAAQRQSVSLTRAYMARAMDAPVADVDVAELVGAAVRNGVPPEKVYERMFVTVWTDLDRGVTWEKAVAHGLERATATAQMDVQLAQTHTIAAVTGADTRVSGFERVANPGACDLCLIASTQRYKRGQLLPIHNRCGCTVRALIGPSKRTRNPALLAQLKADGAIRKITAQRQAAAARQRSGIKDVAVREHGELGPLLTPASDDFTHL